MVRQSWRLTSSTHSSKTQSWARRQHCRAKWHNLPPPPPPPQEACTVPGLTEEALF